MHLFAQTVLKAQHIYLWQIAVAGGAVLIAAILVVLVLAVNFRRIKDNVEE